MTHLFQLPACSPFLELETSVPLRLEIVPLGSGQHGWLPYFTKSKHYL